ncbi:hypothetical protein GCM10027402_30050 [Arthrobacter monumenti]
MTVFDAGVETDVLDGRAYLIMELVDGPDLHRKLSLHSSSRQGRLSGAETAAIGLGIATALTHIHRHGTVHRGVKPANILIGGTGNRQRAMQPKLADAGIAALTQRRGPQKGEFNGTAAYFSPEQAAGEVITAAADIYSLALVLFECLTGEVSYTGEAVPSATGSPHGRPHIPATLGHEWVELLTVMTDRDPAARPTSVEVAAALRAFSGHQADDGDRAMAMSAPTELVRTIPDSGSVGATPTGGSPSENRSPQTSSMPTVSGTNALQPASGWTGSRLDLPEEDEHRRNHPGRTPAKRRSRRPVRWLIIALIVAIALMAGATALTLTPDTGSSPVDYPAVPGELGPHLENLQESVQR